MVELPVVPGDFILTHGTGFFDKLIQFGQAFRYTGKEAYYNHAALIVSEDGNLIEALGSGVKQTNISKYPDARVIHIEASLEDRVEAVNFAKSALNSKDKYGFITVLSTAICVLFGQRFCFGFSGTDICSGLVAQSLERTNAIFPTDARHMSPADLVKYYETNLPGTS